MKFGREFKREALKLITERVVSVGYAAKDLDIHTNMLRAWFRELRGEDLEAFPVNSKQEYSRMPR